MGCVCWVPAALSVWPRANRRIRSLLMAICFLPALNIAGLLAAGDTPSISWQMISGASVSIGRDREEVRQAYTFLNEVRKANKDMSIYSFSNGILPAIFENVGMYEQMIRPDLPVFHVKHPVDWVRGFFVRVNELLDSDYILIRKYGNKDGGGLPAAIQSDSLYAETKSFELWLSTLHERYGVEIVSEGRVLRLLRIVDRAALYSAIEQFVSTRAWRQEFTAVNQPVWWSTAAVVAYAKNVMAEEIEYDGVYKLHALAINHVDDGIKIEVWWEELRHEGANHQRYFFLHLVNSSGEILHNQQIALYPYEPPLKDRRLRYGTETFYDSLFTGKVASLGFGIYQSDGGLLLPDNGKTDWDGKRILIPINAISSAPPGTPATR
jgi:hypothetical protein